MYTEPRSPDFDIRKNCKALNEEECPRTLKGEIFMEENMELMEVKNELDAMTDDERDMFQKIIGSMLVGIFKSIDKDKVVENVKAEFGQVVGEEVTDEDLVEAFGENGIDEIVEMFNSMSVDNISTVMDTIGLGTFADVGYLLDQNREREKLTAEE